MFWLTTNHFLYVFDHIFQIAYNINGYAMVNEQEKQ